VKVVVTGGAGFIGANLCTALRAHPDVTDVVALDDLSTGARENLAGVEATLVEGSILDPGALDACCEGARAVVHLAARPSVPRSIEDPVASHRVNTDGTVEVLEAARRAGGLQVIVASSSSVYGANPELPKRETLAPRPVSPYAASKLAAESYALAYQHSFGLPVLAFRFFNVFGPLQAAGHAYAAVVPAFLDALVAGRPLPVHGDGRQTRDFTFVDTVTTVITEAVTRPVTHDGPVNLAFGTRTDLLGVIDLLAEITGVRPDVAHADPRAGDVRDSQADDTILRSLFPDVVPVPLIDGLRRTYEWFEGLRG
jgi:UDP-glucose 4-epimerase